MTTRTLKGNDTLSIGVFFFCGFFLGVCSVGCNVTVFTTICVGSEGRRRFINILFTAFC